MISYRKITTLDPEYSQEKELRNRILRAPLGLVLSDDDLRGEDDQIHLIALDGKNTVVGCVLVAIYGDTGRVRQMAVDESFRNRGVGSELIHRAEQAAAEAGVRILSIHARLTAKDFYGQRGYCAKSDVFIEVTIPHLAMEKVLQQ